MANLHVEPVCNCDEWGRDYFMRTMYPEGAFDVLLEPVIEHGLSVKCIAHTRNRLCMRTYATTCYP